MVRLGLEWAFEKSKPAPSDTSFPTGLYLLILPKQSTRWGLNIEVYEPMRAILTQTTQYPRTLLNNSIKKHDENLTLTEFEGRQSVCVRSAPTLLNLLIKCQVMSECGL